MSQKNRIRLAIKRQEKAKSNEIKRAKEKAKSELATEGEPS